MSGCEYGSVFAAVEGDPGVGSVALFLPDEAVLGDGCLDVVRGYRAGHHDFTVGDNAEANLVDLLGHAVGVFGEDGEALAAVFSHHACEFLQQFVVGFVDDVFPVGFVLTCSAVGVDWSFVVGVEASGFGPAFDPGADELIACNTVHA